MNARFGQRVIVRTLGGVWLAAVLVGLAWLARYDNQAGTAAAAPLAWPDDSRLARDGTRPTLLMFAHPLCTCTSASLGELAELMARTSEQPRAYVVFIDGVGRESAHADLVKTASAIPGVTVVEDDERLETARFGAETSGQTLLYDAGGRLLFSGGTTGSRGHRGDNEGRATILALLNHTPATRATWSVFGCSLFGPGEPRGAAAMPDHVPDAN